MKSDLSRDLRMRRPFESPEQEAFLLLQRVTSELMHAANALLKGHGLSSPQYNVLRILRGAGESGATCREIGERMVTRDPDVTRILDRLVDMGLVRRRRSRSDRRVVRSVIDPAGLRVLDALDAPMLALHGRQLGHLSRTRLVSLIELLETVRSAPAEHDAPEPNHKEEDPC